MVVSIVRFKSALSEKEVVRTCRDRAPRYEELPGLIQKYYLKYPETGEFGAVYVWDSQESLDAFRGTELGRTIQTAYKVEGLPAIRRAEVFMTLRL